LPNSSLHVFCIVRSAFGQIGILRQARSQYKKTLTYVETHRQRSC